MTKRAATLTLSTYSAAGWAVLLYGLGFSAPECAIAGAIAFCATCAACGAAQ